MEGLITFLLVLIAFDTSLLVFIAFDTSSISNKLGSINRNLIDIKEQIKKEGNNDSKRDV